MSDFTIFRNNIEDQLGIRTPDQAAQTAGNLTAQAIAYGARGGGDTTVKPSPSAPNFMRSISTGNVNLPVVGAVSGTTLLIAVAIYFFLRKR